MLCNSFVLIFLTTWRSKTKTRLQIHKTNSQLHQSCNNSSQVSPFLETSFVLEEIPSLDNIRMNATEQRLCCVKCSLRTFPTTVCCFAVFCFQFCSVFEGICAEAPPLIGLSPERYRCGSCAHGRQAAFNKGKMIGKCIRLAART